MKKSQIGLEQSPEQCYLSEVSIDYRKKLGQYFTPVAIADFMSSWILGMQRDLSILDPAVGLGIFFRSMIKQRGKSKLMLTGYDVDETMLARANPLLQAQNPVQLKCTDYLSHDWQEKYDGIICNPPYLMFKEYDNKGILAEFAKRGIEISAFSNIYALFLLKSLQQLKSGGRIAYIVPSEFLNSDYGKKVKEYLKESELLRFIIIIDFRRGLFDDALTTSSILLLADDAHTEQVEFINVHSLDELKAVEDHLQRYPIEKVHGQRYQRKQIMADEKWRVYYQKLHRDQYNNLVPFSRYVKVSRGIATGANKFFTFSESKRKKLQIDLKYLLPCLTKAQGTEGHFFTQDDFDLLKAEGREVYLLYLNDHKKLDTHVKNYLERGKAEKIDQRYLARNRTPWYSMEYRKPAPILATVFNRKGLRFVRNELGVYHLTCFHAVYVKPQAFEKLDLLMAYLLTDVAKEIFTDSRREYGSGLKKYEPNDLNNAFVVNLDGIAPEERIEILNLYHQFCELEREQKKTKSILGSLNHLFKKILLRDIF